MYRCALAASLLSCALSSWAHAQTAPAQLRGKSVVVSWTENRSQKVGGEAHLRQMAVSFTLSVYVSTQGRTFRRLDSSVGSQTGRSQGIGTVAKGGGVVTTQFQGRSMHNTATAGLSGGAVRISATFNETFSGCSATAVFARQTGGAGPIIIERAQVGGQRIEVHSVTTGPASCAVRSGNVFGGTD